MMVVMITTSVTALGGGAFESLEQRHVAGSDGQPERLLLRLVLDEEAACRGHLHVGHMYMCTSMHMDTSCSMDI